MLREDPQNKNVLYVGTDIGVYVTLDQGQTWSSLSSQLPTIAVNDLVVHPRDRQLVIGTHGRSIYILDLNPVQEWSQIQPQEALRLFSINPVTAGTEAGARPEAPLYFYLREARPVRVEILRESGETVRVLDVPGEPGMNAVYWDLKPANSARTASAGKYTVKLTAGESSARGSLEIRPWRGN